MVRRTSNAMPRPSRGVYEQPPDDQGNRVFVALTDDGECAGVELVRPGGDTKPAIVALWDQLDAADPVKQDGASFPVVRLHR